MNARIKREMEDKIPPFKILLLHGAAFPSFGEETRGATNDALPRNSRNQRRRYAVSISGGHRKPLCMTLKETKRSPRGASFDAQKKRRDKGESLSRKSVALARYVCPKFPLPSLFSPSLLVFPFENSSPRRRRI